LALTLLIFIHEEGSKQHKEQEQDWSELESDIEGHVSTAHRVIVADGMMV